MITLHSIDLAYVHDKCFAEGYKGVCRLLTIKSDVCRTSKCPFYKPDGCKDWVRVEDDKGTFIIPIEEYKDYRRKQYEYRTGIR